jgi:hypothetical protein
MIDKTVVTPIPRTSDTLAPYTAAYRSRTSDAALTVEPPLPTTYAEIGLLNGSSRMCRRRERDAMPESHTVVTPANSATRTGVSDTGG